MGDGKYIYIITTKFLNSLKDDYTSLNFCYYLNEHSDELIKIIKIKFNIDYIHKHKDEIKSAIENFFAPLYKVKVSFTNDESEFKIITKVLHNKPNYNDELIQKLVPKIAPFRKELMENLKEHAGIKLKKEMRDEFLSFIDTDSKEEKEALKLAIKEALELDKRDLIIYLSDSIVIKQFKLRGYERRSNALPNDELEKLKNRLFPTDKDIQEALDEMSRHLLTAELDMSEIDNLYFMHHYKQAITKSIINYIEHQFRDVDKNIFEAFSTYFMRENFNFFLEEIAKNLLKLVMKENLNAEEFIRYYSGEIEVNKYGRYEKPRLIDDSDDKRVWNPSILITIAMQYNRDINTLKKLDLLLMKLQESAKILEEEESKIAIQEKNLVDKLSEIPKDIAELNIDSNQLKDDLAELKATYQSLPEEQKEAIQEKIDRLNIRIKHLNKMIREKFELEKELNLKLDLINSKISNIKTKEIDFNRNLNENLNKKDELLKSQKQIKDKFNKIVKILAKALQKKRIKTD